MGEIGEVTGGTQAHWGRHWAQAAGTPWPPRINNCPPRINNCPPRINRFFGDIQQQDENQRQRRSLRLRSQRRLDSCVLSNDDEDETRDNDVYMTDKVSQELGPVEDETTSSKPSGPITCPICMDVHLEIMQSGRLFVSTKRGHVFCIQYLRHSLKNANSCPTCRKKLPHRQYHPIYM
ncbi:LOW QUALITY PROTEIN: E3 ubiquitin-protein ligase RNF4-like [Cuculus canorus]|uniref:LOW QUALITY PROTEIN: E3 ubiquitin-protein ligase RNF4-like n=1 Tax=Cuculus canorus TaxID=55661 RepID=UPI0023AAB382|nr:LOW QUALITY PROTEIN: E3 ubiquitin-protein ligase RNF4-like [Cuculus canorus]